MGYVKKFAIMVLGIIIAAGMTSCEKEEVWLRSDVATHERIPDGYKPWWWGTDSRGSFMWDYKCTRKVYGNFKPTMIVKPKFSRVVGNDPVEAIDSLSKRISETSARVSKLFNYNYDLKDTVEVEVELKVVVLIDGQPQEVTLKPIDTLWIKGVHEVESVETTPFKETSRTKYSLINQLDIEICSVEKIFQVDGNVNLELISREFTSDHLAWEQAVVNGANIALKCNNMASLVGVYSDGRTLTIGNQLYKVTNNYQVQGLGVALPSEIAGNTYNFNNGNVTVAGNAINIIHQGYVVDNIIIDGVNYKDSVNVCHATPQQISFNNGYATITFVDEEGENVIVNFDINYQSDDDGEEEEEVTVTSVTKTFDHLAFRNNATVSGNQISLICDNVASFVSNYSDGSHSSPTQVNYTVTDIYSMSAGTLSSTNIGASAIFTHNGSGVYTATIGGVDIILTSQDTIVANIIYNGVNYKNYAPKCVATPSTICLISSSQARITFVHGSESITAYVAVTTQVPTTAIDLPGQVVKAYVTLSYTSNISTTPEAWFHVLVNDNGTYKIYSALWQNGLTASSFAQTSLSANQYNTLIANLNAGEGIAKVYHHYNNGATFVIGTVKGQQYNSGAWKISYYNLGHALENVVDFSAQTFSGYNGENPIITAKSGAGVVTSYGVTVNIQ